jgi:hypothetical protein
MLVYILFQLKHFICDFPLQAFPYQYLNKGKYGHAGGLIHSLIHGIGTFLILLYFSISTAFYAAILDFIFHYHIDWAKVNVAKKFNLKSDNSEWFWILLGFDQFLHQLTYIFIIWLFHIV